MPHVIVKMYAGRSEAQKAKLAEELTRTLMIHMGSSEASVSVSIEDVEPHDWVDTVYKPDIVEKPATLYKKPGYDPR
ncbi:tautomerase family protein [Nitrospirillum sp. BR 11163]|uniref:tautomerase family protein n=1 Tax=Nitrospirillum sp. BR 11163 TaxID=3104323 RepID=UPI002AFE7474|nr:tautomerase family protein [Nitrospirillum sp. BR 11163]MEA1673245.1 tautomerase family protein [Nitrospirillum sp. BR 11163]